MRKVFYILLIGLAISSFAPHLVSAQSDAELSAKIEATKREREALLEEQRKLQAALDELNKESETLSGTVKTLDATRTKLSNDLKITQASINSSNLTIQKLTSDISKNETAIDAHKEAIKTSIQRIRSYDSYSMIYALLAYPTLDEVWSDTANIIDLQEKLGSEIKLLENTQKTLIKNKAAREEKKVELVSLSSQIKSQKEVADETRAVQAKLLAETKGKEAEYQRILAENVAKQKQFEEELFKYESQLENILDPSSIPRPKRGILSWPVRNLVTITQYFGYTPEAAKLYKTTAHHPGIDFRASIGTPIFAALEGTVTDTESVKIKQGCQYGKWVLIRHPNGLSTIYGHLSSVLVQPGQLVKTGQIIGYSGVTGYATGPHLHFGLYASSGIKIVDSSSLKPDSNCAGIKTVAAPISSYLDPLAYLPRL